MAALRAHDSPSARRPDQADERDADRCQHFNAASIFGDASASTGASLCLAQQRRDAKVFIYQRLIAHSRALTNCRPTGVHGGGGGGVHTEAETTGGGEQTPTKRKVESLSVCES
eukprot:scaffold8710_cov118-Isochrysis_galbana.AAC.2